MVPILTTAGSPCIYDGPSRSALSVASYRGMAGQQSDPLCHDPWALLLVGPNSLPDHPNRQADIDHLAVRTRFFDDCVARGTDDRTQIVLLGAGLDTRAARLARPGVRYFELDRHATQSFKLRRLGELGEYPIDAATYVPCDLEDEESLDHLLAAGFNPRQPALFLCEGLTMYLEPGTVRRLFRFIADQCHAGGLLVFDFIVPEVLTSAKALRSGERGEPLRWGVDPPEPFLRETGFSFAQFQRFSELAVTYQRPATKHRGGVALASNVPFEWPTKIEK